MLGAVSLVHLPNGFFWNAPNGGGIEIHLLFISLALAIVLRGGAFSVDRALTERLTEGKLQRA